MKQRTQKNTEGNFEEVVQGSGKICVCPECGTRLLNIPEDSCADSLCPNCEAPMILK